MDSDFRSLTVYGFAESCLEYTRGCLERIPKFQRSKISSYVNTFFLLSCSVMRVQNLKVNDEVLVSNTLDFSKFYAVKKHTNKSYCISRALF